MLTYIRWGLFIVLFVIFITHPYMCVCVKYIFDKRIFNEQFCLRVAQRAKCNYTECVQRTLVHSFILILLCCSKITTIFYKNTSSCFIFSIKSIMVIFMSYASSHIVYLPFAWRQCLHSTDHV